MNATSPAARPLRARSRRSTVAAGALAALCCLSGIGLSVGTATNAQAAGFDNADGTKVDAFDSMTMLLPKATVRGTSSVKLTAAKNEYESFQIKVSAGATPIKAMSVSLSSTLTAPNGATIPTGNVRFNREDYYKLTTMSDQELKAELPHGADGMCQGDCRVPDALIPERDLLTNEDRAAFPAVVPANENRVAWVDVLVPATAPAGTYSGSVVVKDGATTLSTVPVSLDVLNVAMPSTATLQSQTMVMAGNIGLDWSAYQQLAELGLANRMSIVPQGFQPRDPKAAGVLGPLLNGTDPKVPLAGARLTQLPFNQSTFAGVTQLADYKTLLTQLGKADVARFWCDEIATADCGTAYTGAVKVYPGIKLQEIPKHLMTLATPGAMDPRATMLFPEATELDKIVGNYQQWAAADPARELWFYTGCGQGGCDANDATKNVTEYDEDPLFDGTPGYGIDQPTSQSRAMGWQGFRIGAKGEHYWNATVGYGNSWVDCAGIDPNNCWYTAGGDRTGMNGDGDLFYKWNQAKIGGTTPIPAESIRLKRFRDGREDNELMNLLAGKGKRAEAMAVNTSLFPTFTQNTRTPAQVATARGQLEALVRQVFPTPVTPTARPAQDLNCDGSADLLGVTPDGRLLFYGRVNGDWDPNAPKVVATGWASKYRQLLLPGDINGDGKPDLLGRTATNTFDVWNGNCTGGFVAGPALGAAFTLEDPSTPGDFNGDGKPDLMNRKADGTLWLAAGTGANTFNAPQQMGAGWTNFTIVGAGDADRDGRNDVFGRRSDGRVFLYRGNGAGGWITGNGEDSGLTLSPTAVPRLLGPGDMNNDGKVDMVVIDATGEMLSYIGNGAGGWAGTTTRFGGGWNTILALVAD